MATLPNSSQSTQNYLPHLSHPVIETAAITASSPPPPISTKKCDANTCPWWPYSSSKEFKTNAGLILLIVFLVVLLALTLNAAFRYILRKRRRINRDKPDPKSGESAVSEPPPVYFTAGMKLAGAEPECAICLSEFVEGDEIRVMEKCNHGFHVQCIKKWLNSRSSCPVCRSVCTSENGDLESGRIERRAPPTPLV